MTIPAQFRHVPSATTIRVAICLMSLCLGAAQAPAMADESLPDFASKRSGPGSPNPTALVTKLAVAGCLTRSPQFWGTHPDVTAHFLDGTTCGVPAFSGSTPYTLDDAIEDLCSTGEDASLYAKGAAQAKLVQQCAAVYLNLVATKVGGGNCLAVVGHLKDTLETCCTEESRRTGDSGKYPIDRCILLLDQFNHAEDTLGAFGPFRDSSPAEEAACDAASRNGVLSNH